MKSSLKVTGAAAWLQRQTRSARQKLLWAWLAPLLATLVFLWQAWLLASIVQALVVDQQAWSSQVSALVGVLVCLVIRALLILSGELAGNRVAERLKLDLRRGLWRRLLGMDLLSVRQRVSGELAASMVHQIEALEAYFARYLPAMYVAGLIPLLLLGFVLPVDWVVGLLLLFSAPLIPVFMALIGWRAKLASEHNQQASLRLSGFFADRVRGIFTLGLLGRRQSELERVYEASHALKQSTMRVLRIAFLSSAVLELFAALGVAGAAVYIGLGYLGYLGSFFSGISLQQGLFCLLLAPEVYQPLRQLAVHYHDKADAQAALDQLERVWGDVSDQPPEPLASSLVRHDLVPSLGQQPELGLEQAVLCLPDSDQVLLRVPSLRFVPGVSYALMGESGSGKSSLLETLVGLRVLHQGQRYFSRQMLDTQLLTVQHGVVLQSQRPFMTAGTVASLLRLAAPQADEHALWQALESSQAAEFVRALPAGLETELGHGAFGLSGGQIQRLALARVFLSSAQFILLDEPTAHLDSQTRDAFMDALLQWGKERCLIIATHDPQLADRCQQRWSICDNQLLKVGP